MKNFYTSCVLAALLIVTLFTCCSPNPRETYKQHMQEKIKQNETVKSYQETPEEACKIMLDLRREMIESQHIDSTYINMPIDAIICIILKYPDFTIEETVKEYERNIKYYTDLITQKDKIEKYKEKLKEESIPLPDSIPNSSGMNKDSSKMKI